MGSRPTVSLQRCDLRDFGPLARGPCSFRGYPPRVPAPLVEGRAVMDVDTWGRFGLPVSPLRVGLLVLTRPRPIQRTGRYKWSAGPSAHDGARCASGPSSAPPPEGPLPRSGRPRQLRCPFPSSHTQVGPWGWTDSTTELVPGGGPDWSPPAIGVGSWTRERAEARLNPAGINDCARSIPPVCPRLRDRIVGGVVHFVSPSGWVPIPISPEPGFPLPFCDRGVLGRGDQAGRWPIQSPV